MKTFIERRSLAIAALVAAGIAPNLFPAAQAGLAPMPQLACWVLIPSIVVLAGIVIAAFARNHRLLGARMTAGIAAGLVATVALEIVRTVSFRMGGMPGDLPRLLGVLITDRFMLGPSALSDLLGYGYHFWNGACFGLIYAVLFARRAPQWATLYGLAIGVGFLASPAVRAMGVGFFARQMPAMIATVLIAHVMFGLVLGLLLRRWSPDASSIPKGRKTCCALETVSSSSH